MKIKFGSAIVDGRGKIGGHVASKNRGGAYLRTKVTPVNPQSLAQQANRVDFQTISQGWRDLTESQRKQFIAAVSDYKKTDIFGDIRVPSGSNLYQKLNMNLSYANSALISVPDAALSSPVQEPIVAAAAAGAGTFTVDIDSAALPADVALVVECTGPVGAGQSFVKNRFTKLQTAAPSASAPFNIAASYVAKYGALVAGQKIFVRTKMVNTTSGIASGYSSAVITVAA